MDMTYNNTSQNTSDLEKKSEDFLNETILNVILRELPEENKKQFYSLIEQNQYEEAREFALEKIPDFEDKLSNRIKELLS